MKGKKIKLERKLKKRKRILEIMRIKMEGQEYEGLEGKGES